jgi:ADP-heptose:LPS heptosyltransferase
VDPARVARHLRVAFKRPPPAGVVARYAAAAGVVAAQRPWLPPVRRGTTLIVAPGAAHRTKRWPGWAALAAAWDGPVRAIGGPGEEALVDAIGGVCERGFTRTLEAMEGGAVLAAGDTGLLHLGFAVGLPVVGVFGPTTSIDGFFGHVSPGEGAAVELDLPCRPCSRFGGDTCFLGDHACMRALPVEAVLAACRRMAAS